MLILMELKNLHTIPQTQGMVTQLRKDGIEIIKANPKLEEYLPKLTVSCSNTLMLARRCFPSGLVGNLCGSSSSFPVATAKRSQEKHSNITWIT